MTISSYSWEVTTSHKNKESIEVFSDLVVCNGHHWKPSVPQYSGNFNGSFIHSHNYKKASPFINKNVLVIGGGNSACDVAVETSSSRFYSMGRPTTPHFKIRW